MPVVVSLFAAVLSLLFIWQRRRVLSVVCLLTAILVLGVSSLPVVAGRLLWSLERQYPPVSVEAIPAADCIVLLGGALGVASFPRVNVELTDAADRVYQSAKLYRLGMGRRIIVAAGNQPWARDLEPEANMIRELLVEWGVPAQSIILDSTSRNTRENAINGAALIRQAGCQSNLLVTSAWHMPRAVASFRAVGVAVIPVTVDVRFVEGGSDPITKFIPRADALAASSQVILEWMGIWVYRWNGWN
jgi:uncharacterized SAM-binding protein YcdF (DUF218 family)